MQVHRAAGGHQGRAPHALVRLRPAAAREAETAPHVRGARAAVRQLLPQSRPPERRHRREPAEAARVSPRSEEHTSELQSQSNLVCRLLLEKKKKKKYTTQLGRIHRSGRVPCKCKRTSSCSRPSLM